MNAADSAKTSTAAPGLFVALLVAFLCLTRPSMFGQEYNLVGGIGVVFTTLAFLVTRNGGHLVVGKASPALNITVSLFIFWSYILAMSIFYGTSNVPNLLKATSGGFSVALCFLLLSSNSDLIDKAFSILARVNSGLGYSIAITYCLLPIVGYSGLRLFTYTIGGYDDANGGNGDILFPFSVIYGKMAEYGIYRFCGIYREAGIAQAFFVWSFVYLMYSRAKFLWILGTLLGALLCGATAVIFSIAAVAIIHFGGRSLRRPREALILLSVLAVLTLLFLFVPGLGLMDKAATHGASITDREEGMALALPGADIWRWLLGHGLFYDTAKVIQNAGINAIAAIFGIGAIGFILYTATFFAGMFGTGSYLQSFRYLTLVCPFLITSLFFQPIIDAPLVMAVLFAFPPAVRRRTD